MDNGIYLVWAIFAVVAVAAIVVGRITTRRRRERLATWARQHGLHYAPVDNRWIRADWGKPFGQGSSRAAIDVFTGPVAGRPALFFTYRFTTGSGDSQTTHYHQVFARPLLARVPRLKVGREGVGSALLRAVGVRDLELESEDFNKAYAVDTDVPRFGYDVLSPQMMEFLLAIDADGFLLQDTDLVYVARGRLDLADVPARFAYLDAILDRIPARVFTG